MIYVVLLCITLVVAAVDLDRVQRMHDAEASFAEREAALEARREALSIETDWLNHLSNDHPDLKRLRREATNWKCDEIMLKAEKQVAMLKAALRSDE